MNQIKSILIATLLLTATQCQSWSQQDTDTAVDVAHGVLSFVQTVLDRSQEAMDQCDVLTVENTEIRRFVRMKCSEINGAREFLLFQKSQFDSNRVVTTEDDLREAAEELDEIIDESGLVR
jgi:hypothetical protein